MTYQELYKLADEALVKEVAEQIRNYVDEEGEEYYPDFDFNFDALLFRSDYHYNDEFNSVRLTDILFFKEGAELNTDDFDFSDLVYELEKKYPRLLGLCDKIITIKQ